MLLQKQRLKTRVKMLKLNEKRLSESETVFSFSCKNSQYFFRGMNLLVESVQIVIILKLNVNNFVQWVLTLNTTCKNYNSAKRSHHMKSNNFLYVNSFQCQITHFLNIFSKIDFELDTSGRNL